MVVVVDVNSGGASARELATASRKRFGSSVPIVFAGTKIDARVAPSLSNPEGLKMAKEFGPLSKFVDVSALKGTRCALVVQSAVKFALAATPSEASKGNAPAAAAAAPVGVTIKSSVFAPPPPSAPLSPPLAEPVAVPAAVAPAARVFKAPSKAAPPPGPTVKIAPFAAPPLSAGNAPVEPATTAPTVTAVVAPRVKAVLPVATVKLAPFAPPTAVGGSAVAESDTSSADAVAAAPPSSSSPPSSRIAAAGRALSLKKVVSPPGFVPPTKPPAAFAPPPPGAAASLAPARSKPFPVEEVMNAIPPKYATEKLKEYLDTCSTLVKVWLDLTFWLSFFFF